MLFGKIDYLNLLPFYVHIKRSSLQSSFKESLKLHKGTPSKINELFLRRKVDAAFISSIKSKNKKCLNIGIVAKREILSVILKPGAIKLDDASATSNILAKILNLEGEVIIGDRALRLYLNNPLDYIDLANRWYEKFRLPFVFARLCYNKNRLFYLKLANSFLKKRRKIPKYLLLEASKKSQVEPKKILTYLQKIDYKLDRKSLLGLKKFLTFANSNLNSSS